jgi:hypothetical protein
LYCGSNFTRRSNRDKHLAQGNCSMVLAREILRR